MGYSIWMPHPQSTRVWRIAPNPIELNLVEGPVREDTTSVAFPQVMAFNGYGAAGDVRGEVVYVNYGLIEDYAQLDSMGVSVKGRIAIARYGRSFRGIKAREAEKHGAVGLIIYSDPADDGYVRGNVYPEGPMRPSNGVQRGSVMNANGDPSTRDTRALRMQSGLQWRIWMSPAFQSFRCRTEMPPSCCADWRAIQFHNRGRARSPSDTTWGPVPYRRGLR